MIKKIRIKFVIITMSMLTAVFGILFVANTISDRYWYKQDVIQLLENLSESSVFRNQELWGTMRNIIPKYIPHFLIRTGSWTI